MPPPRPELSVVVPFHDAPANLERCLAGLSASTVPFELVLVDDASSDAAAIELARASGGRYHRLETNSGPAVARNAGARIATGEVLAFVDSDVVVAPDALQRLLEALRREPEIGAAFGSYDDSPASRGTVSEYRNLLHHFVHQTGPREATTFWAGCGAVRREVFLRAGGFDERYRRPSIEDIELGMRLHARGIGIRLCPEIQCKHLKRWRLAEMVAVDVTRRAMPWTRLLIERPGSGRDLNLSPAQRLCVALVFLAIGTFALGLAVPALRPSLAWLWLPALTLAPVLWINRGLYALFARRRGPLFAFAGIFLHLFYYLYGGLAYLWVRASHRRPPQGSRSPAA